MIKSIKGLFMRPVIFHFVSSFIMFSRYEIMMVPTPYEFQNMLVNLGRKACRCRQYMPVLLSSCCFSNSMIDISSKVFCVQIVCVEEPAIMADALHEYCA